MEIVVTEGGEALVADTRATLSTWRAATTSQFKTPANLPMTPRFVRWLRGLVDGMVARGYRGIAMDVEFMRLASDFLMSDALFKRAQGGAAADRALP